MEVLPACHVCAPFGPQAIAGLCCVGGVVGLRLRALRLRIGALALPQHIVNDEGTHGKGYEPAGFMKGTAVGAVV